MEWWLWITWWFIFSFRYSILYQAHNKKHETFSTNPPIHIYVKRINNGFIFEIKHGHKLELQTPETMKLFGSAKILNKTKNGEIPPSLEIAAVVLVQCNIEDNQDQQ